MPCIESDTQPTGYISGPYNTLQDCENQCLKCSYTWSEGTVNPSTGLLEPGEWLGGDQCPPECPCEDPPLYEGASDGVVAYFDCKCAAGARCLVEWEPGHIGVEELKKHICSDNIEFPGCTGPDPAAPELFVSCSFYSGKTCAEITCGSCEDRLNCAPNEICCGESCCNLSTHYCADYLISPGVFGFECRPK